MRDCSKIEGKEGKRERRISVHVVRSVGTGEEFVPTVQQRGIRGELCVSVGAEFVYWRQVGSNFFPGSVFSIGFSVRGRLDCVSFPILRTNDEIAQVWRQLELTGRLVREVRVFANSIIKNVSL